MSQDTASAVSVFGMLASFALILIVLLDQQAPEWLAYLFLALLILFAFLPVLHRRKGAR